MSSYQKEVDEVLLALRRRVDEDPLNWDLRLIYADRLAELADEPMELAQRWMTREHRRPGRIRMKGYKNLYYFLWGHENNGRPSWEVAPILYPWSMLPLDLWCEIFAPNNIVRNTTSWSRYWRYFHTAEEAERSLGEALFHHIGLIHTHVVLPDSAWQP